MWIEGNRIGNAEQCRLAQNPGDSGHAPHTGSELHGHQGK
jgi:hypothetical protein